MSVKYIFKFSRRSARDTVKSATLFTASTDQEFFEIVRRLLDMLTNIAGIPSLFPKAKRSTARKIQALKKIHCSDLKDLSLALEVWHFVEKLWADALDDVIALAPSAFFKIITSDDVSELGVAFDLSTMFMAENWRAEKEKMLYRYAT